MSFILDALKKSETERQQQSSAEFSSVPASSGNPSPARWLWMLGLLLLVNFAVLIGILLKPTPTADAVKLGSQMEPTMEPAMEPALEANENFEEQVAIAIDSRAVAVPAPVAADPTPPPAARSSRTSVAVVPTMDELRLEGTLQIAEMHLDIHVYSEAPKDRFVFINMNKHREGSRTAEGPVVREIRTDGVILEYQDRVFLLPRE